jgi:uncharacterized RDD family membrane protein YckC
MTTEDSTLPTPSISSGAGFWIRAGAQLIDVLYGTMLGFIGGVITGIMLVILSRAGWIAPGWQSRVRGINIPGWGFSLVGACLYHVLTEGMYGASLGKLICQLRVVTEEGRPIGMKQALWRSLAYYIDALFFGIVAYSSMKESPLNQRYGDKWAHTIVIRSKDLPAGSGRGFELFVLSFLMGSVCWTVLLALGLIIHVM